MERMPPHNLTAEKRVLGGCLRDNRSMDEVDFLRTEDFFTASHQIVWQGMTDLYQAGRFVDLVSLGELLKKRNKTEELGNDWGCLADLYDGAATGFVVKQHADMVRDLALQRELLRAGADIMDAVQRHETGAEALQAAEARLFVVAEGRAQSSVSPLSEAVSAVYDLIDARRQGTLVGGVKAGLIDLDAKTSGFRNGELTILAARPSVGKTAIALSFARTACRAGKSVYFASLEQSKADLAERLLCAEAGVDGHCLRTGRLSSVDMERLIGAGNVLRASKLWIDDSAAQTVFTMMSAARRLKRKQGLDAIFVDYLQLVDSVGKTQNREQEVSQVSRHLKRMAKELAVPVVACAQLNRQSESRAEGRPRLSDVRESGAVEQDADLVILLHKVDDGLLELNVAKQRNGPTGTVTVSFRREHMRFDNFQCERENARAGFD